MGTSSEIRMTPDQMRTRAGEYTTQGENLQQVINSMDRLLTQLQSEWTGKAADGFTARFTELRPGFVKAKELIDEISAALKSSANTVEQTDQSIGNAFRG